MSRDDPEAHIQMTETKVMTGWEFFMNIRIMLLGIRRGKWLLLQSQVQFLVK